jgi:hypothetical protein
MHVNFLHPRGHFFRAGSGGVNADFERARLAARLSIEAEWRRLRVKR